MSKYYRIVKRTREWLDPALFGMEEGAAMIGMTLYEEVDESEKDDRVEPDTIEPTKYLFKLDETDQDGWLRWEMKWGDR